MPSWHGLRSSLQSISPLALEKRVLDFIGVSTLASVRVVDRGDAPLPSSGAVCEAVEWDADVGRPVEAYHCNNENPCQVTPSLFDMMRSILSPPFKTAYRIRDCDPSSRNKKAAPVRGPPRTFATDGVCAC